MCFDNCEHFRHNPMDGTNRCCKPRHTHCPNEAEDLVGQLAFDGELTAECPVCCHVKDILEDDPDGSWCDAVDAGDWELFWGKEMKCPGCLNTYILSKVEVEDV